MADITSILEDLAAGRIDAAEAARRIDAAQPAEASEASDAQGEGSNAADAESSSSTESSPTTPAGTSGSTTGAGSGAESSSATKASEGAANGTDSLQRESFRRESFGTGKDGVQRVVVRSVGRRVRIIGDSSVAAVAPSGPHVLRRSGSTIEVSSDGDIGPSLDGFSLIRPPRSWEDLRTMSMGKELVLRINPAIAVDVEVTAGSLSSTRVPVFGKVRVTAGGANLSDVVEVSDALIQAGSATIQGPISQGRSRVRVESGSLTVRLSEGANVAIRAESNMAKVSWPGESGAQMDEYVVGNGSARLDIGAVMGHASIRVDEDDQ